VFKKILKKKQYVKQNHFISVKVSGIYINLYMSSNGVMHPTQNIPLCFWWHPTYPSCNSGVDNLQWNKVKFSPINLFFHFICLFCPFFFFVLFIFECFFIHLFCSLFFVYLFLFMVCCVGLLQIILKKTLYFKQKFVSLFVNVLYHP